MKNQKNYFFHKKIIFLILIIILLIMAFSLFSILNKKNKIKIIGDKDCIKKTNNALQLLRKNSSEHYNFVVENIGIIECVENKSGIFPRENPPRFQVGKATYNSNIKWYASVLVHEACHSWQYKEKKEFSGEKAELECLAVQYFVLVKLGADENLLNLLEKGAEIKYWENYSERWW